MRSWVVRGFPYLVFYVERDVGEAIAEGPGVEAPLRLSHVRHAFKHCFRARSGIVLLRGRASWLPTQTQMKSVPSRHPGRRGSPGADRWSAADHPDRQRPRPGLQRGAQRRRRRRNPESTDRSLTGRAAGLPESSAGVPAFAGRCRSEERAVAQRGSGALRARARGCARRARACWREPWTRAGAVGGRQAGSGSARNRARAAAHWPAQGQRFARCRVQRRAEWVSRPARAK